MGTKSLSIRDRKDLVASGRVELTPRKVALLYAHEAPTTMSGEILGARHRGASKKVAAEAGGLTLAELEYVFELAEAGHPAWREFYDEWLRESAAPQLQVMEAVYRDAVDPEKSTVARQRFALEVMDPGTWKEEAPGKKASEPIQTQNFVVNVRDRFDVVEGQAEEVTDAEEVG
jgi:hypothetical protein